MSRIDEALKRARESGQADSAAPGENVARVFRPAEEPASAPAPQPGPPSVPPSDVFTDAWTVTEGQGAAPDPNRVVAGEGESEGRKADGGVAQGGGEDVARVFRPAVDASGVAGQPTGRETPETPADASAERPADPPAGVALFQGFNPLVAEKIVAAPDMRPAFVEQYRKLAGILHHAQLDKNLKVVMVTSAVAGEGKSLTATNLALTFSESYRRSVLLIDADLRRPILHETFQVPNISGLGDGLRAEKEQKLSLVQVSPRLTLLTAGRPDPDPMSGLTSERMKRVIEEAASRFDWVIIDTPPVGLLPDAKLLAAMADTTLLVIRAAKTPYAVIRRAVDLIGRDHIFGVVLNRAEDGAGTSGYSYYSYYDSYAKKTA